jgi:chemotaxis protein MotA
MVNVSTTQAVARGRTPAKAGGLAPGLDLATIVGVLGGFALIVAAVALSGSLASFIDVPSILIVVAGTFLVTSVSYSVGEVIRSQKIVLRAALYHQQNPSSAALQVIALADKARQNGVLTLEQELAGLRYDSFLFKAVALIVDGLPGDEVERVLTREVEATLQRHTRSAGILRRSGEVAPAMGLIGTLVGLVQMLGNLEDPSAIGPAMAVALLTTFYGAVLANMVFLPLANKLERNSQAEALVKQIYALGAASIGRQENPRRLEMSLNTLLSPAERVSFFD